MRACVLYARVCVVCVRVCCVRACVLCARVFDPDLPTPAESMIADPLKCVVFDREALGLVPLTFGSERVHSGSIVGP